MFTLSLADAKASDIPNNVNLAPCDPRFVALLNKAQSRLANAGRWWGTYQAMRVCVTNGCITWPRSVKTVEAMNLCGYGIPVRNQWYEYRENVCAPRIGCGTNPGSQGGWNGWNGCTQEQLLDRNRVCQFTNLPSYCQIRIYPTVTTDAGKKVVLQGNDSNGEPIRTIINGVWAYGTEVTLANPFVTSGFSFLPPLLTGVQKDITNGNLLVYAYEAASDTETLIAVWEPSEKAPVYRRDRLAYLPTRGNGNGSHCCDRGNGCEPRDTTCAGPVADAMVRMEFIPALVDTDWLFISSLEAIEHMMLSQLKRTQNEYPESEVESAQAVKLLRQQLDAYNPPERQVLNVEVMGTAGLRPVFGGFW